MNEAETRAEHIDPALKAAGWGVVEGSRIRREYRITEGRIEGRGRRGNADIADYVLEYHNHKLAVVEAKAWDEELTEGVGQAKDYADKLVVRLTYSANGKGIYGIDMETGKEGEIAAYPTPDELWTRTFAKANAWRAGFRVNDVVVGAQKRLQAETAAELDALLPAILPPSPSFGGTGDRAWTRSLPARSGCALSLREIRLARSQRARLKGEL
jgi:hypothetical protein